MNGFLAVSIHCSESTICTVFYISNAFVNSASVLHELIRWSLIHITVILLWYIFYLVYLCSCVVLGLFLSYLCDLFFIFCLFLMTSSNIILLKQTHLFRQRVLLRLCLIVSKFKPGLAKKMILVKIARKCCNSFHQLLTANS